jgi:OOP family OmpA-OmpF porin
VLFRSDEAQAAETAASENTMCEHEPVPGALLDAKGCAMDSDNDNVLDGIDMCANTPAGVTVDDVGCPIDSDRDGVADYKDLCPNTPEGVIVDDVGCPIDSDRDGVADYKDLCPNTPEGVIVDEDGCPIAGQTILSLTGVNFEFDKSTLTSEAQDTLDEAVEALLNTDEVVDEDGCPIAGQTILSLTGVNFEFDKSTLTSEAQDTLDEAVEALLNTDEVVEVRVEGHTDSIGSEEYNKQLSQERAQSVVDYLVSNGVNGNNLIPVGMGETSPVANNATDAGRALNRRVDFVVNSQ